MFDPLASASEKPIILAGVEIPRLGRFCRDTAQNEDPEEAKDGDVDECGKDDALWLLPLDDEPERSVSENAMYDTTRLHGPRAKGTCRSLGNKVDNGKDACCNECVASSKVRVVDNVTADCLTRQWLETGWTHSYCSILPGGRR